MSEIALELRGISKRFGSVDALDDVSLVARRGSIHALLGENGAGKTTLMRVAFGMLKPDSGNVAVNGIPLDLRSPADAIAAGVGMVHQQFSLVPQMTVAENVALGGRRRFRPDIVARRIADVGRRTGLTLDPLRRVMDLGSAERQKLEIIRILAHDADILILDEPTAVLTSRDIGELFTQLRAFAAGGGCIVLITHKLHDALAHADEVTVLRRGRLALNAVMSDVDRNSLTSAMIGSAPPVVNQNSGDSSVRREVVAAFKGATSGKRDQEPLSFEVLAGEVLGVAALDSGAATVLRMLAGRIRPSGGSISIPSHIGFVPENRIDEALVPVFTLTENFALKAAGIRGGIVNWMAMRAGAASVIQEFDVMAEDTEVPASSLSGGNQQRFVLGRELHDDPPLLVLENPTQGLDVSAAASVHRRVRSAAARGTAIVFYSSDLDELVEISDRVMVMNSAGVKFSPPERESIGRLLLEAGA
ncbi:MAG: ABC transporter ATP-binding protein [Gemmatimonadaceae bacterium]